MRQTSLALERGGRIESGRAALEELTGIISLGPARLVRNALLFERLKRRVNDLSDDCEADWIAFVQVSRECCR
jgi:hypothetical protein